MNEPPSSSPNLHLRRLLRRRNFLEAQCKTRCFVPWCIFNLRGKTCFGRLERRVASSTNGKTSLTKHQLKLTFGVCRSLGLQCSGMSKHHSRTDNGLSFEAKDNTFHASFRRATHGKKTQAPQDQPKPPAFHVCFRPCSSSHIQLLCFCMGGSSL